MEFKEYILFFFFLLLIFLSGCSVVQGGAGIVYFTAMPLVTGHGFTDNCGPIPSPYQLATMYGSKCLVYTRHYYWLNQEDWSVQCDLNMYAKSWPKENNSFFIVAEYENPFNSKEKVMGEYLLSRADRTLHLSSPKIQLTPPKQKDEEPPELIKLKSSGTSHYYNIKVSIFENKGDTKPLDVSKFQLLWW